MYKIISLLLLSLTLAVANNTFTKDQLSILNKIKTYAKPYNLENTLMAIAYVDSDLGKNIVDQKNQKYGIFKVDVKGVLRRYRIKYTQHNVTLMAQKLTQDFEFNITNAIQEINFWKSIHKQNWLYIWASYNSKNDYNSKEGASYANKIARTIEMFKKQGIAK